MGKMKLEKVKVKRYDLKAYGLKKPVSGVALFVIVILISALDYGNIFSAVDSAFSGNSGGKNHIITGSIVFVLDILTITISEKIFASAKPRKAIPWVTVVVVVATMIATIVYRMLSVDAIFATDGFSKETVIKIAEALTTTTTSETATHATTGQKFLNGMISFLPIATTLFGVNVSQKRALTVNQIALIRNKKEISTLNTQIFELNEYDKNFDDDLDNLEKRQAMERMCEADIEDMNAEKNNALAKKLNDPTSITYITRNSNSIDFDSVKNPNKHKDNNDNERKEITKSGEEEESKESV